LFALVVAETLLLFCRAQFLPPDAERLRWVVSADELVEMIYTGEWGGMLATFRTAPPRRRSAESIDRRMRADLLCA
jgi:hypothetical protein